ncbi:P-II family nitrogen regulator [Dysosmobacter sp. HCP28S3_G4]|uniref:P-II family nitrogen regulator n=1 Tax=Dysosmobacter sp. HCP28S3_G4 TaxID=3438938 RepID=UPI003F8C09F5
MSELYLMVTVTDRKRLARFITFYKEQRVAVNFVTLGTGTASNETMDCLGLESSDKSVTFSVVTGQVWERLRKGLESRLRIDVPGTGIAFIVPLSSIGGRRELLFLTENQDYEKGEESTLKDTTHELLVVIANHGYSDQIMDAAREAGAAGGTVIHAKGTGMERAERFLGVSLAPEKEMIFIVAKKALKNGIMQSIMQNAGMESKAKSIVFSLPVTATAGLRLMEED